MNISTESGRLGPEARAAVAIFLRSYEPGSGPFAISEAIEAVRRTYPALRLSENELTAAIAEEAAAAGLGIAADKE